MTKTQGATLVDNFLASFAHKMNWMSRKKRKKPTNLFRRENLLIFKNDAYVGGRGPVISIMTKKMKRQTNNDVLNSIGNPVVSIHRFPMQMILANLIWLS